MPRFLLDATRDPLKNLSGREIAVTLQPPTPDLAPSPITETLPEYCVSKLPGLLVLSSANVPSPRSPPVTRITAATSTPPGTPGFEQARKTSLRLGPVISEGGWGIVYKAQELSVAPSQAPPLSRASSSATASSVTTARRTSALEAARQPFLNDPESLDDVPSASRRQCLAETPSPTAGAGVPISTTASKLRKLLLRSLFVNSPDQKKQQFAVKVLKRAKADSNSPLSIKERTLQDTEARNHMRASSSGHSGIVKLWGVMCDDEEEAVDGNHDYPFIDNQTDDVEDREPVLDGHEPEMRRGMFTMKAPHSAKGKEKAKATVISRSRTRPRTVLDGKMFLVMVSSPFYLSFHQFEPMFHPRLQDYCEGGDLYEAIEKGKYYNNIPATSSIILQLFSAIEHLHGMGIYHRDLKPENILLVNRILISAFEFLRLMCSSR
jgi:serine/threonine protein kinase